MHHDAENSPHELADKEISTSPSAGTGWQALGGLALGLCLLMATVFATKSWSSCEPPDRPVRSSPPSDSPESRMHLMQISATIDEAPSLPPGEPDATLEGPFPESEEDSDNATPQPNPLE